jgi:hypothetical protein
MFLLAKHDQFPPPRQTEYGRNSAEFLIAAHFCVYYIELFIKKTQALAFSLSLLNTQYKKILKVTNNTHFYSINYSDFKVKC